MSDDDSLGELDRVIRERIDRELVAMGVREFAVEFSEHERRLLRRDAQLRAAGKPPMTAAEIPYNVQPAVRAYLLRE